MARWRKTALRGYAMYKAPPPIRRRKRRSLSLRQPPEITTFKLILITLASIPFSYAILCAAMFWSLRSL
jgi:hypothetical protein